MASNFLQLINIDLFCIFCFISFLAFIRSLALHFLQTTSHVSNIFVLASRLVSQKALIQSPRPPRPRSICLGAFLQKSRASFPKNSQVLRSIAYRLCLAIVRGPMYKEHKGVIPAIRGSGHHPPSFLVRICWPTPMQFRETRHIP